MMVEALNRIAPQKRQYYIVTTRWCYLTSVMTVIKKYRI